MASGVVNVTYCMNNKQSMRKGGTYCTNRMNSFVTFGESKDASFVGTVWPFDVST